MKRIGVLRAGLGAALALAPGSRLAAQPLSARVAIVPIDTSCALYAAQAQGWLSAAGLDISVATLANGGAIETALVGGATDIGQVNTLSIASARERGIDFRIIAPLSLYTSRTTSYGMIVAADAPIRTVADLTGKTVAINILKGIGHISAQSWIDERGGDSKNVRFVEMPFPTMGAALSAHRIDAAVMTEPLLSSMRGVRNIGSPFDGIGSRWLINAWVARDEWLAQNAAVARRFAGVMLQAGRWANGHRDQTAVYLSSAMKLDLAVVRGMHRDTFVEKMDPALVQPVIETGFKYGVLAHRDADIIFR
jgi:NitT/TauT family transport system substrate-binding protein